MLDLVHVRSFIAVATDLHFGRAAKKLGMTQPPLSRQIRLLEEHIGTLLFERSRHGVRLTNAGRTFLPEARLLMARAEAAEVSVRQARTEPEGTIRLGFFGAASFRLLPHLIIALRDRYPRVRLDLKELDAVGQNEAFSFGRLDLGLVRPSVQPAGLTVDLILRERLLVALRQDHPLARRSRLRPADLAGQLFIGYSPEAAYMHDLVRSVLLTEQVGPEVTQQVAHAQAMLSLVSAGLGISILPEHARFAGVGDVVFRPLLSKDATAVTHLVSAEDARRPVVGLVRRAFLEAGSALEVERG